MKKDVKIVCVRKEKTEDAEAIQEGKSGKEKKKKLVTQHLFLSINLII